MIELKPAVVHFSGGGGQNGLFFQTADGQPKVVPTDALADAFGAAGSSVQLVVLNAYYSEGHAQALLAHVDCVVGMSGSIDTSAARNFAIGFYGSLGQLKSVAAAYKQGRAAIKLEGLPDADRPQLRVLDRVDATSPCWRWPRRTVTRRRCHMKTYSWNGSHSFDCTHSNSRATSWVSPRMIRSRSFDVGWRGS